MYVYLQVLSESVSKALQLTGGSKVEETAQFVLMMDKFLDSLNVSNFTHGIHSRKPFQLPYRSGSDHRLKVNIACLLLRTLTEHGYKLYRIISNIGASPI